MRPSGFDPEGCFLSVFCNRRSEIQYAKIAISVSLSKSLVKYYFHFLGVFLWWTPISEQRFKQP